MLPFSYQGRIHWTNEHRHDVDATSQYFLRQFAHQLQTQKGQVTLYHNYLTFTGGMFRPVSRFNPLSPITRGTVSVHNDGSTDMTVRYKLHFTQLLVVSTIATVLMCSWVHYNGGNARPTPEIQVLLGFTIWNWLVGVNIVSTLVQFPAEIRQVLQKLPI